MWICFRHKSTFKFNAMNVKRMTCMIVHKYFDFRFHSIRAVCIRNYYYFHITKWKTLPQFHCNWCLRKNEKNRNAMSQLWHEDREKIEKFIVGNDSMRRLIILMMRRFQFDHSVVQSVAWLHFNPTDVNFILSTFSYLLFIVMSNFIRDGPFWRLYSVLA